MAAPPFAHAAIPADASTCCVFYTERARFPRQRFRTIQFCAKDAPAVARQSAPVCGCCLARQRGEHSRASACPDDAGPREKTMPDLQRRQLLSLIGGVAAAWPLMARAQQGGPARRVGMLIGYAENDLETQARLAAFRQGLEHLGWSEGRNLRIDTRFAPEGPEQAQRLARELLALQPDVLVGNSTP